MSEQIFGMIPKKFDPFQKLIAIRISDIGKAEKELSFKLNYHNDRYIFDGQVKGISYNNGMLPMIREQICEYFGPGIEDKVSQKNFKVALCTLYSGLGLDRVAWTDSVYVLGKWPVYGLWPNYDISLVIDLLEKGIDDAKSPDLE